VAGTKSLDLSFLGWFHTGILMLIKGIAVSVALIALAPDAMADEQSGLLRRASCTVVRYYVTKYSAAAAEAWARSHGATEPEIDAARHCLTNAPAPAQAKTQTVTAGWAGQ
jgi:hypothetical protein